MMNLACECSSLLTNLYHFYQYKHSRKFEGGSQSLYGSICYIMSKGSSLSPCLLIVFIGISFLLVYFIGISYWVVIELTSSCKFGQSYSGAL